MKPELLTRLEAAWKGDVDLLASLYAEKCTFEDKALGLQHHGRDGVREAFETTFSMMPDFQVEYGDHILTSDGCSARWTFTGSFHPNGRDGDGPVRPVRVEGISFMTLSEGFIKKNVDFWNPEALKE